MITQQQAHSLFIYKQDGSLLRKKNGHGRKAMAGMEAGYIDAKGYRRIKIGTRMYKAHQIVWAMHGGEFPQKYEIDHINHIRHDNRIENLRMVTKSDNQRNRSITLAKCTNSGVAGVTFEPRYQKWHVRVSVNQKSSDGRLSLGMYDCLDDAITARKAFAKLVGYLNV